jgi:heme a synthase
MENMYSKSIKYWLILGCVLLFFQVIIGGVTRITGSGLSITKWEIVTGTLPPMTDTQWEAEFDLYKETPQYVKLNEGMSMSDFKFIYFWEYFHRLWARIMGFVFLIPAIYFALRKELDSRLGAKLIPVIGFAILAAIFGWIMVASGFINRPWVNAYKLTIHLSIAAATFAFLVRATLFAHYPKNKDSSVPNFLLLLSGMIIIQFILGGVMSGMKAGLVFPTWPDMGGKAIPDVLKDGSMWTLYSMEYYDASAFAPALIQILHRSLAYLIAILVVVYLFRLRRLDVSFDGVRSVYNFLVGAIGLQVLVGILTVVNCKGEIPLFYGVLHQGIGLCVIGLLAALIYTAHRRLVFK